MQKNTRLPPRHLRLSHDPWLNHHGGDPQFAAPDAVFGEPSWFLRTYYPGYSVEDLADYYRRSRSGAPVVANPNQRMQAFEQQMYSHAANEVVAEQAYEDGRHQTPLKVEDKSWALIIAAVIIFAAAIILAAAIATS